jgi:hypothetical protein
MDRRACVTGIEYTRPGMELKGSGGKWRVVIPASQGFDENITDFRDDARQIDAASGFCPDMLYSTSVGGTRGTAFNSDLAPSRLDSSIRRPRSLASSPESGWEPGRRQQRRWSLIDCTWLHSPDVFSKHSCNLGARLQCRLFCGVNHMCCSLAILKMSTSHHVHLTRFVRSPKACTILLVKEHVSAKTVWL